MCISGINCSLNEIADLHAPVIRRRIRGVPHPWLNDKISEPMKDRDFHHRKAVKTNSDFHWAYCRKRRNRVNHEVKAAKSKYYCDLILEAKVCSVLRQVSQEITVVPALR